MKKLLLSLAIILAAATAAMADPTGLVTRVTGSPTSVAFTDWVPDPATNATLVAPWIFRSSSTDAASFQYGNDHPATGNTAGPVSFHATLLPAFDTAPNVNFVAGYLQAHNGTVFISTSISQVTLEMAFSGFLFLDGGGLVIQPWSQTLKAQLNIVNTVNLNVNPNADADVYYFTGFENRAFHVLESLDATVEILLNYDDLSLAGFGAVVAGSGFVGPVAYSAPDNIGLSSLPVLAAALLVGTRFRRRQA